MKYMTFLYMSWYSVRADILLALGISIVILVVTLAIVFFVSKDREKDLKRELGVTKQKLEELEKQSEKKYITLAIRYNEAINKYSHIVYSYLANNIEDETEAIAKLNEAVKGDYEWLETKRVFSKKDRKIMEAAIELTDSQKENILNLMQSMSEK